MKKISVVLILLTFSLICLANSSYTDKDTGLQWSARKDLISQNDAVEYCKNLKEDGKKDWRVPTFEELKTLVVNCPAVISCKKDENAYIKYTCGPCSGNNDEEFSKLKDSNASLLSSTTTGEKVIFQFIKGNSTSMVSAMSTPLPPQSPVFSVRCVRGKLKENALKLKAPVFNDKETKLSWHLASDKMKWYDAEEYCEDLKDNGSDDWRLPTIDELKTLFVDCQDKFGPNGSCPWKGKEVPFLPWELLPQIGPKCSCMAMTSSNSLKWNVSGVFWSSTSVIQQADNNATADASYVLVFFLYSTSKNIGQHPKNYEYQTLCVRKK